MASIGAPVVTGVIGVTGGATVVVEIAHTDTGVAIAVAAVEAGKGAVGAPKREVTAQKKWMSVAEDRATRHRKMHPTVLMIRACHPLRL